MTELSPARIHASSGAWRERVGPLRITSGGRSAAVLAAIGGASTTSHHQWADDGDGGVAVDVIPVRGTSVGAWEVLRDMAESGLPVNQGILYSVRGHVHVGMRLRAAPAAGVPGGRPRLRPLLELCR